MSTRLFRALAAALLLVGLTLTSAAAGGWATIVADTTNPPQPNAGQPFTFGFMVLQHGVTPAGWVETPTFVGIETVSGTRVEAKANGQGADGHFVATVTLPKAGVWTWQVVLTDLVVQTTPQPLVVATAAGKPAPVDSATMLAGLERLRGEIRADYEARLATQADELRGEISKQSTQIMVLQSQRDELSKRVTALSASSASATRGGAPEGLPLIGVISLAILAGAISGFAMTALGRSQGPSAGATSADAIDELAPSGGVLSAH
jgi:hypothetical protein